MRLKCLLMCALAASVSACVTVPGSNSKADPEIQPERLQAKAPPAAASAEAERNCPKPVFPQESLRAGHKGSVDVAFLIGADGAVAATRIAKSSGFPLLDAAGINAISACRFKPVAGNSKPAPAWFNVTYHFLY